MNSSIPISSAATNSTTTSIDSIQLSIQNLLKHWDTRQKYWTPFFRSPDQEAHQLQHPNTPPWRTKLATFLESTPLRIAVIVLLLLDLFLTTLDLSSSILTPCHPMKPLAAEWFHWVEIGILSLLCAKLVALLVAIGPTLFFGRPGYVIDGVVVVGALVLEGLLERRGGGLVVVVSLWRVVRVVESAFELSDEAIEAMIKGIVLKFEALRAENAMLFETIADRDRTTRMLQEMVDKLQTVESHCILVIRDSYDKSITLSGQRLGNQFEIS